MSDLLRCLTSAQSAFASIVPSERRHLPQEFMPYLGVYLSLVTLKGRRFYSCLCLIRTDIKPRNKNFKLPPRRQLEPALNTNVITYL